MELPRGCGRVVGPVLATAVLLVPIAWLWFASLVPARYSVLEMGAPTPGAGRVRSRPTTPRCPASRGSDVAFVADNPGIWMDHCHNLQHAADEMIVHLMYTGVTTPFVIGGPQHNRPE